MRACRCGTPESFRSSATTRRCCAQTTRAVLSPSRWRPIRLVHLDSGRRTVLAAALLALLPLLLATWTFGRAFRATELERQDAKLAAAVRLAGDRMAGDGNAALRAANVLASEPGVLHALVRHDRAQLSRYARRRGRVSILVLLPDQRVPPSHGLDLVRTVAIVGQSGAVGRVVARVQLDDRFLREPAREAGATLLLSRAGFALTGHFRGRSVGGPAGRGYNLTLEGGRYRAVAAPATDGLTVVALGSQAPIDAAVRRRQALTLAAGAATIAAIATIALMVFPAGRARVRRRRDRGERSPLALVGDAFAATHDARALLPLILETTVGATGAKGGRLLWDGEVAARIGSPLEKLEPLVLPLDESAPLTERVLELYAPHGGFTAADRDLAASLVAQGRIALENARLHGLVQRQAVTDELTDLPNRRRFMEALRQEVARANRLETSLALVLFDLDDFKYINDRCGHQVGDDVLRLTGHVIRNRVRETDIAGRVGGEEFAVLLPGTDARGAAALAEHLRQALTREVTAPDVTWPVTASFGVAIHRRWQSEAELIAVADKALYRAKAAGKNQVACDGPSHSTALD